MLNQASTIYEYITSEIANFKLPIDLMGWQWSMADHIKQAFYYKHSRLLTGNADDKPVKNIIRPILNLQYRTEDLDVKDIILYVDDPEKYHLSFLVKKYHDDVFLRNNNLDSFLDEANESRIDYGGSLIKDVSKPRPEVVTLDSIAFCDQTDILSGPICIKHYFSPDQLKEMEKSHWGDAKFGATISIDDLIILAQDEKKDDKQGTQNKTPGKYIEIYELHGNLPERFLKDNDSNKFITQTQIIAYYKQRGVNGKQGVTLFRGKRADNPFKLILRDPIHGRALGFGGVEELVESQVWTNYNQIRFREMLDAAAKTILQAPEGAIVGKKKLMNYENMEVVETAPGTAITQVDSFPRNIQLFVQSTQEWAEHAQQMGAANDSIMGEKPNAGTPFKLQELVTKESHGLHEFRRGKFAKDIEEIYRDWIIPYIVKEINKGQQFLSELSLEEMQTIADNFVKIEANKAIEANPDLMGPELEEFQQRTRDEFMKDNKKFIVILKDELKDASISIKINIAGKQKDLYLYTDKLVNVFRQIAAAPQMLDDPRMAKIFNQILESSGLSPIDFGGFKKQGEPQMAEANQPTNITL